jgi:hypothetical protein
MNATAPTGASGNTVTNVPLPTDDTDVATKAYVDDVAGFQVSAELGPDILSDAIDACYNMAPTGKWTLLDAGTYYGLGYDDTDVTKLYFFRESILSNDGNNSQHTRYQGQHRYDSMLGAEGASANWDTTAYYYCVRR